MQRSIFPSVHFWFSSKKLCFSEKPNNFGGTNIENLFHFYRIPEGTTIKPVEKSNNFPVSTQIPKNIAQEVRFKRIQTTQTPNHSNTIQSRIKYNFASDIKDIPDFQSQNFQEYSIHSITTNRIQSNQKVFHSTCGSIEIPSTQIASNPLMPITKILIQNQPNSSTSFIQTQNKKKTPPFQNLTITSNPPITS